MGGDGPSSFAAAVMYLCYSTSYLPHLLYPKGECCTSSTLQVGVEVVVESGVHHQIHPFSTSSFAKRAIIAERVTFVVSYVVAASALLAIQQ